MEEDTFSKEVRLMFFSHKGKFHHLYHFGQVYGKQKIFFENCAKVKLFNLVSDSINISNLSAIKEENISNFSLIMLR